MQERSLTGPKTWTVQFMNPQTIPFTLCFSKVTILCHHFNCCMPPDKNYFIINKINQEKGYIYISDYVKYKFYPVHLIALVQNGLPVGSFSGFLKLGETDYFMEVHCLPESHWCCLRRSTEPEMCQTECHRSTPSYRVPVFVHTLTKNYVFLSLCIFLIFSLHPENHITFK